MVLLEVCGDGVCPIGEGAVGQVAVIRDQGRGRGRSLGLPKNGSMEQALVGERHRVLIPVFQQEASLFRGDIIQLVKRRPGMRDDGFGHGFEVAGQTLHPGCCE